LPLCPNKLDVGRIQPVIDAAVREGAVMRPIDAKEP